MYPISIGIKIHTPVDSLTL